MFLSSGFFSLSLPRWIEHCGIAFGFDFLSLSSARLLINLWGEEAALPGTVVAVYL